MEHRRGEVSADWITARLTLPEGAALGSEASALLARYVGLVLAWRTRVNVTGARDAEALVDEHVADALALLPYLPAGAFSLIDVGSGAGLPGLVLAIVRPESHVVLLEPIVRKRAFLSHAVRSLGLGDRVEVRGERLDEHLALRGGSAHDVAIARAVWPALEWLELGRPLVRPGGRVIGLEGSPGAGLPVGASRHPYQVAGRSRAVIVLDV